MKNSILIASLFVVALAACGKKEEAAPVEPMAPAVVEPAAPAVTEPAPAEPAMEAPAATEPAMEAPAATQPSDATVPAAEEKK